MTNRPAMTNRNKAGTSSAATRAASPRKARGRPVGRTAQQTRRLLIAAAEQHFETRSYDEVKLDEIAESAGLSGPAIYNHFSSKDDLFLIAIIARMTRYNEALEKAVSIPGNWKARYNNLLELVRPLQGTAAG